MATEVSGFSPVIMASTGFALLRNELVDDACEVTDNHHEENVSKNLMNRTQRRARLVGDRERQRTLLINAAQRYDARRDIERENRQEREHHDAAKRVVSKIDGVTTSLEFLDIGGDCRRRKGETREPRVCRAGKAPYDAKDKKTSDGGPGGDMQA